MNALPRGAEKRAAVRAMFDRIAPRYDRLNRLFTAGLDQRWRRTALATIGVAAGDRLLDVACGTGDLSELAAETGAQVVAADFAREMLRGAGQRRVDARLLQADSLDLPFADGSFSALSCGFALRNFTSLPPAFAEMARVLAPGGRIALLDVDRPHSRPLRAAHSLYFDTIVPRVGGLLSDRAAYAYLPQSTAYLPDTPELLAMLTKEGFSQLRIRRFLLGSAQLIVGVRP